MNKDITIVCSRLDLPGGIERAVVNTANLFSERGHRVTLLILDETAASFYKINDAVAVDLLNLSFGIGIKGNVLTRKWEFYNDLRKLKQWMRRNKPSIIVASEYHLAIAASMTIDRKVTRIYSWEHHHYHWLNKSRFWNLLYKRNYSRLNGIICLTHSEKKYYEPFTRTIVIPNYIPSQDHTPSHESKVLLTIGALVHRKGIDRLLPIALSILKKFPGWKWRIIGEGPMEKDIIEFTRNNSLEEQLLLEKPVSADLSKVYRSAEVFILTSRFEAFPMVLLEAMSYGLPCISFDCPSGPSEIIQNGHNGYLVENGDNEKMISAIGDLLTEPGKRKSFSAAALERANDFSPEKIYPVWEKEIFND